MFTVYDNYFGEYQHCQHAAKYSIMVLGSKCNMKLCKNSEAINKACNPSSKRNINWIKINSKHNTVSVVHNHTGQIESLDLGAQDIL